MTHTTKRAPLRTALPAAALAALLLAGCSTGHIGETWQCPLAEGGSCGSVAAADPAVPDPKAGPAVLAEPLWRVRAAEPETFAETPCSADCGAGFDPFGWLARLLAADPGPASGAGGGKDAPPSSKPAPAPLAAGPDTADGDTVGGDPRAEPREANPESAPLPAEAGPALDDPSAGDLRTGEIVARIWIAPFVDGNGVYREASHVRAVLEPAGWRLK